MTLATPKTSQTPNYVWFTLGRKFIKTKPVISWLNSQNRQRARINFANSKRSKNNLLTKSTFMQSVKKRNHKFNQSLTYSTPSNYSTLHPSALWLTRGTYIKDSWQLLGQNLRKSLVFFEQDQLTQNKIHRTIDNTRSIMRIQKWAYSALNLTFSNYNPQLSKFLNFIAAKIDNTLLDENSNNSKDWTSSEATSTRIKSVWKSKTRAKTRLRPYTLLGIKTTTQSTKQPSWSHFVSWRRKSKSSTKKQIKYSHSSQNSWTKHKNKFNGTPQGKRDWIKRTIRRKGAKLVFTLTRPQKSLRTTGVIDNGYLKQVLPLFNVNTLEQHSGLNLHVSASSTLPKLVYKRRSHMYIPKGSSLVLKYRFSSRYTKSPVKKMLLLRERSSVKINRRCFWSNKSTVFAFRRKLKRRNQGKKSKKTYMTRRLYFSQNFISTNNKQSANLCTSEFSSFFKTSRPMTLASGDFVNRKVVTRKIKKHIRSSGIRSLSYRKKLSNTAYNFLTLGSLRTSIKYAVNKPLNVETYLLRTPTYLNLYNNFIGNYSPKTAHLLNLRNRSIITPTFTKYFYRSPFFSLNRLILKTSSIDVLSSIKKFQPGPNYLVFPDANDIKVSVFRKLNKQKNIAYSRSLMGQLSKTRFVRGKVSNRVGYEKSYDLNQVTKTFSSISTKHARLINFKKSTNKSLTGSLRIRRIRFKPGYSRLWRVGRRSVREILNLHHRYEYRLSPKLHTLYFKCRQAQWKPYYSTVCLGLALMTTKFAPDMWTVTELLNYGTVFLNGKSATNQNAELFVNDFIQLIIHLKFYIAAKWVRNFSTFRKNRVNKIFYRKFRPSPRNKDIKIVRKLPTWFWDLQYAFTDVPRFFEIDFFTLSVFMLHNNLPLEKWVPQKTRKFDPLILNMYNWKYIT